VEIKAHPWFKGINWTSLRQRKPAHLRTPFHLSFSSFLIEQPPFLPSVTAEDDSSNFEDLSDNEDGPLRHTAAVARDIGFKGEELPFIGYSFTKTLRLPGGKGDASGPTNPHSLERTASATSLGGKVEPANLSLLLPLLM